jgi:hypothetical protein
MVKIELKYDKDLNFLMILYQKIKKQNDFENLQIFWFDLDEKDKEDIKKVLRSGNKIPEELKKYPRILRIFLENKEEWEEYFKTNEKDLKKIIQSLQKKVKKYNWKIFDEVVRFFESENKETIKVFVCMGNEKEFGTGNAFTPNLTFLFPRNFKEANERTIDQDFAVMIHEIFHIYQNMCNEPNKEFMEKVANCFAPRGILINEDKISKEKEFRNLFEQVKKSFEEGGNYRSLKEDLNKSSSLDN